MALCAIKHPFKLFTTSANIFLLPPERKGPPCLSYDSKLVLVVSLFINNRPLRGEVIPQERFSPTSRSLCSNSHEASQPAEENRQRGLGIVMKDHCAYFINLSHLLFILFSEQTRLFLSRHAGCVHSYSGGQLINLSLCGSKNCCGIKNGAGIKYG